MLPPSTADFLGKVGLNLVLGLVTSIIQFSDCMMETCMLFARVGVHEHW